jgi:hypothetical protein
MHRADDATKPHAVYPLVVIEWTDAWYDPDEQEPGDWKDEYPVRTVGYLVREVPVYSVAQEVLADPDTFRAVTHIPRAMVTRMTLLQAVPQGYGSAVPREGQDN